MIKEIRDGFNVKRFHTATRLQEETNGHHTAGVLAIILALDPDACRSVLIHALYHDVAEAYTGDVPYPFKADTPGIKAELAEGEHYYLTKHGIELPPLGKIDRMLLKAADMTDLVLSCLEELNKGNRTVRPIIERGQEYIVNMNLPEDWQRKIQAMVEEVKSGGK